jgi:hypothetical protein
MRDHRKRAEYLFRGHCAGRSRHRSAGGVNAPCRYRRAGRRWGFRRDRYRLCSVSETLGGTGRRHREGGAGRQVVRPQFNAGKSGLGRSVCERREQRQICEKPGDGDAAFIPRRQRAESRRLRGGARADLSPKMEAGYEKFYATFVPEVFSEGKMYRLEESNSLFHGGATNISNTAASALWGLDFMWWWATHDAEGVNFHTGMTWAREGRVPGGYDLFWRSPERIEVHPMGYAVKTFDVAGHGRVLPVELGNPVGVNVTAYAAGRGPAVFVTVINRENVKGQLTGAHDLAAEIDVGRGKWKADVIYLRSPNEGLAGLRGMTLGGTEIAADGTWQGKWEEVAAHGGKCVVHLKAGQAAAVRLGRE